MNKYNVRFCPNAAPDNIQRETLFAENAEQVERIYLAINCTVLEVELWNEIPDADGTYPSPIISGGEVLELDSYLESRYDELSEDMPF